MLIIEIKVSPRFVRNYKKLPSRIKSKTKEKEKVFRGNPFHSTLGTHKLSGKDKEHWSFWVNRSYRVKFIFLKEGVVLFLDVGTHDIYK